MWSLSRCQIWKPSSKPKGDYPSAASSDLASRHLPGQIIMSDKCSQMYWDTLQVSLILASAGSNLKEPKYKMSSLPLLLLSMWELTEGRRTSKRLVDRPSLAVVQYWHCCQGTQWLWHKSTNSMSVKGDSNEAQADSWEQSWWLCVICNICWHSPTLTLM